MENLLVEYGLWILPVFFFIDDMGVPCPSGTLLFAATIFARTHDAYPVWAPVVLAILSAQLGNGLLYFWGRHGAKQWLQTHGHKFFLPQKRLDKFESFFSHHHGRQTIFLTSLVNNVRPFMALAAGSSGLPPQKFFPLNFSGIFVWAMGIFIAGYFLGEHIWSIIKYEVHLGIAILVVCLGILYFWKFFPREILPGYYRKK